MAFEIIRTKVLTLLRQWKDKLPSFQYLLEDALPTFPPHQAAVLPAGEG